MKISIKGVPVALSTIFLAACVSTGGTKNEPVTGSNAKDQAIAGAAVGGAGSFFLCKLLGGNNKSCRNVAVAGAVAGGFIGWQQGKKHDLEAAQAFEEEAKKARLPVVTKTAEVRRNSDQGRPVSLTAVQSQSLALPPKSLDAKSPDIHRMVAMAGQLAASSSEPTTISVFVPEKNKTDVLVWLNEGANQGPPGAPLPKIEQKPLKKGDIPFILIEPTNQQQFVKV